MWVCSRRILSAALAIVLCCIPELGFAMSGQNTAAAQSSDTGTSTEKNVPAAIPDAPGPAQQQAADQANTSGQNSAAQGSQPVPRSRPPNSDRCDHY
jgi:hypothetical protein